MSRISKLFAANAIAAAGLCSAALALSPSAAADPGVSPAVPGVPALNMFQQFITNPASAAAILQSAATALGGASALTGAPSTLPISPIGGAPATATLPGAVAPAAAPVAPPAAGSIAGPIIPLLNQLGVPGDLASLTPSDMPFPVKVGDNLSVGSPAPVAPIASGVAGPAGVPPASNPPVAPTTPGGAGLGQLLPLSALP
jgi:hypothetical protein